MSLVCGSISGVAKNATGTIADKNVPSDVVAGESTGGDKTSIIGADGEVAYHVKANKLGKDAIYESTNSA